MATYISQDELIKNAEQGWDTYSDNLGIEIGDKIAIRLSPTWNYLVHDVDTPNGTRAELENVWVYFDETAHDATNSFDTKQNTTVIGTYYCKSGGNNFGGFRMETSIDGAQRSWRNLSFIQASEGTDGQYNFFPPDQINFPVFTNYQDGLDFASAMYDYLENPTDENLQIVTNALTKSINPKKEKSPEFGNYSEPGGGYIPTNPHGTFDFSSVDIPISPKPSLGVTSAGFINVYKIELNELKDLGEKLFPHFLPAELLDNPANLTTPEMLATFLKILYGSIISPVGTSIAVSDNLGIIDILMNGKLIDYILDCHIIPTSISGATVSPLKIGYRTFNDFQLAKATEDYVDIDCGTLNIKECFGNFLDYTCKVEIFLPGVGYVPLANEYWNNATLQVHYRFNIIDGSFQVRLISSRDNDGKECVLKNSVIAQYGGVCCVHFPITGLQYSNVVSGLVNGTASSIAKGSSGDYAGVATNLANMAMLTPDAPASNGYNASSSFLGQRIPYLVIKRPAPQFSEKYPKEIGLPLNVTLPLNSISGFTVIDNPVLNIACSDEEYNEIISLLKSGVIF